MRITHVALFLVLLSTAVWASNGAFVTVQSLTADLKSRNIDQIDKSLNDTKTMSYKGEILPFVLDLWEKRNDKHPRLPWDVVETNIVRVELADILLQAVKNRRLKLDSQPIHRFVSGLVDSDDPDVARKAIGALSIVDDEADVDRIHNVAKGKDPATFRIAVVTLTHMCNRKAANAIAELEGSIAEPQFNSYIKQQRRDSEEFKNRAAWCDPARSDRGPK